MKEHKRLLMLGAAAAAAILLLLAVLWSHPVSRPELGQGFTEDDGDPALSLTGATPSANSVTLRRLGPPEEWSVAGAMAETYAEALAGTGLRTGEGSVYLGQSPPEGPYLPYYAVGRAYAGWDTSLLPDGAEVVSATLVLELPAGGGRGTAFDVAVYSGVWTTPLDVMDWAAPGRQEIGCWRLPAGQIEEQTAVHTAESLTLYAPESARTMRISLDPAAVDVGGITRLELRHADEGNPPVTPEIVSLGRSQITLEVEYRP